MEEIHVDGAGLADRDHQALLNDVLATQHRHGSPLFGVHRVDRGHPESSREYTIVRCRRAAALDVSELHDPRVAAALYLRELALGLLLVISSSVVASSMDRPSTSGVTCRKTRKTSADTSWYLDILTGRIIASGQRRRARPMGIAEKTPYFLTS